MSAWPPPLAGVLGLAWAVLVLATARRRRPLAEIRRGQLPSPPTPARRPVGLLSGRITPAIAWIGRRARAAVGRPADPAADQRVGIVIAVVAAAGLISPLVGAGAAAASWMWPAMNRRRRRREWAWAVLFSLPDIVDLFVVAVAAGLNVALAVQAVGQRAPPPVGVALVDASRRAARGERLGDALDGIPAQLGDAVRPLITILVTSLRYGAPLLESLERLAVDVRSQRRRTAEEAARRVPVKLLFPLVLCVLPAFALLTVVPLLAGTLRGLRL